MRERLITCVDAATAKRLDAEHRKWKAQVEKAKTPAQLRALAMKLVLRLRVTEGGAAAVRGRVTQVERELRTLRRSRNSHQHAVRVLAGIVYASSVERSADEIAADYDPNRLPF